MPPATTSLRLSNQAMFDALVAGCRALGLRVGVASVQPQASERLDLRTDQVGRLCWGVHSAITRCLFVASAACHC